MSDRTTRDALSLKGVPFSGTLASGEGWFLAGGVLVPRSASGNLDGIGSTRGSLLYRGASAWAALTPGTAGQVLQSGGAGADPSWATSSGYTATAPTTPGPVAFLGGNQALTSTLADIGNTLSLVNPTTKNMLVQGAFSVVCYAAALSFGTTLYTSTNDGTTTLEQQLLYVDVPSLVYVQYVLPFAVVIPASTTGSAKCRGAITPAEPTVTANAANSYVIYSKTYF